MICLTIDKTNPGLPKWSFSFLDNNGVVVNSVPVSSEESERLNSVEYPENAQDELFDCLSDENAKLLGEQFSRRSGRLLVRDDRDYAMFGKNVMLSGIDDEIFVVTRENPVYSRKDDGHLITVTSKTGKYLDLCHKWITADSITLV